MSETVTKPEADTGRHPYDYYFTPGMDLRPPPPRITSSPDWLNMRERIFTQWREVKPTPDDTPLIQRLKDHFWQGDEQMDAIVRLSQEIGAEKVRTMLDTALDHGIEALDSPPPEFIALFAQLDNKPAWFDPEMYERGRVVAINATPLGKLAGAFVNVVMTGQGEAVSSATGATGRVQRDPYRRQLETSEFFRKLPYPNGTDRFSDTFKTIARVRLMHSQVRSGLRGRWGSDVYENHGDPISNTDMSLGVPAYGIVNVMFDNLLGREVSTADMDAVNMYWNYTAYLFGVSENILPRNSQEAMEQFDFILATYGTPTKWSPEVSKAVIDFQVELFTPPESKIGQMIADKAILPLMCGYIYFIAGGPVGDRLLESAGFSSRKLRGLALAAEVLAKTSVHLFSVWERRPGAEARARRNAENGDSFLNKSHQIFERLAAEHDLHQSTFDGHDASTAADFAK